MSHEFRTPLTLILGPTTDALNDRHDPLSAQQRARVETVHQSSERLLKLVNTLLDFSRLESGRTEARLEAVDLAAETLQIAEMFRSAVERAGLDFVVECRPIEAPVGVDREMWAKIVSNLLSNALKFTFEGEISVRWRVDDDAVELAVRDTGIGIQAEDQVHLFERFHRIEGARSRTLRRVGHRPSARRRAGRPARRFDRCHERSRARAARSRSACRLARRCTAAPVVDEGPGRQVVSSYVAEAMRWLATYDEGAEPAPTAAARGDVGRPCSSRTTTLTCAGTSRDCWRTPMTS